MSHYWAATEDDRLRAAISRDWLEDLIEFDTETVAEASKAWRRSEPRRPTIADIRKRCLDYQREDRAYRRAAPPLTDQQRAEIAQRQREIAAEQDARFREAFLSRQRLAEECGFTDFGAMQQFGFVAALRRAGLKWDRLNTGKPE